MIPFRDTRIADTGSNVVGAIDPKDRGDQAAMYVDKTRTDSDVTTNDSIIGNLLEPDKGGRNVGPRVDSEIERIRNLGRGK